jgi:hypothetical protein
MYPFEKFTEGARQALTQAQEEAAASGLPYIGTEHLALALCRDQEGVAGRVLAECGVTYEGMKAQVGSIVGATDTAKGTQVIPTSRVKKVIELAFQEATNAGVDLVGTEHLLAALLVEAEGVASRALDELGVTLPRVRRAIRANLEDRAAERGSASPGHVGTSSPIGLALMRAGQLAQDEGVPDIRADHLIRAMAESGISEIQSVLGKLGLAPEVVAVELAVPDDVRQLGLATRRARFEHAAAFRSGGAEAVQAAEQVERHGRAHAEAVSRWLHEGSPR